MKIKTIITFVFIPLFILVLLGAQQSPKTNDISEYIIVSGNCLPKGGLSKSVNKKLSEGYFLIGGVANSGAILCIQAMGK